jgi:hypothetical protein
MVDDECNPGSLETFDGLISVNLVGILKVFGFAAASVARGEPNEAGRCVCIPASSTAAFDSRVGQVDYAPANSGVVGMTVPAGRDPVQQSGPGAHDRARHVRNSAARQSAGRRYRRASRRGTASAPVSRPEEYAMLAVHIVGNQMLNSENIRLERAPV